MPSLLRSINAIALGGHNELEARWTRHRTYHRHNNNAVAIIAIIFGSGVLIFALAGIFYLVKLHLDRKAASALCNGHCQCQGVKPLADRENSPTYQDNDELEQQSGLVDDDNYESDVGEDKHLLK